MSCLVAMQRTVTSYAPLLLAALPAWACTTLVGDYELARGTERDASAPGAGGNSSDASAKADARGGRAGPDPAQDGSAAGGSATDGNPGDGSRDGAQAADAAARDGSTDVAGGRDAGDSDAPGDAGFCSGEPGSEPRCDGGCRGPRLARCPALLSLEARQGSEPPTGTIAVWNAGQGALEWFANSGEPWLSLSPTLGDSKGELDKIAVNVRTTGLSPGVHDGTITISSTSPPDTLTTSVRLTFRGPPGPPVLKDMVALLVLQNNCGLAYSSTYRLTVSYGDPDGDVGLSSSRVFVQAGSELFENDVRLNLYTGDGFSGTLSADVCLRFNGAPSGPVSMYMIDGGGHRSNTVSVDVPAPAGTF